MPHQKRQAELITIGHELLTGTTVNGNAAYLAKRMSEKGFVVTRQLSIPDEPQIIKKELEEAFKRSSLVVTTGGLGPTKDDITRQAICELFGTKLVHSVEVEEDLARRFGKDTPTLMDQSQVPEISCPLINPVGTAPGICITQEDSTLIVLPGVPSEMTGIWEKYLPELIEKLFPQHEGVFMERIHIFGIPEWPIDVYVQEILANNPKISYGIYPAAGIVSLAFETHASSQQEAHELLYPVLVAIKDKFPNQTFSSESGTLEEAVHIAMKELGRSLAVAESCTGGMLASRLTRLNGSSLFFKGGVVAYSNEAKSSVLDVPEEVIVQHGAVSEPVVRLMAEGAQKVFNSDYSLAVTGIAGPDGGSKEKPVGTVWMAVSCPDQPIEAWTQKFLGPRHIVIEKACNALLGKLLQKLV